MFSDFKCTGKCHFIFRVQKIFQTWNWNNGLEIQVNESYPQSINRVEPAHDLEFIDSSDLKRKCCFIQREHIYWKCCLKCKVVWTFWTTDIFHSNGVIRVHRFWFSKDKWIVIFDLIQNRKKKRKNNLLKSDTLKHHF